MANDNLVLNAEQMDTIGEIMNMSMGAAATAVSSMLEKQVIITTPRIEQDKFKNINCSRLEPAIVIKIRYVEGIEGTNIIVIRRQDMRIILDLLMGNDYSANADDVEFDEMSMSASCEVMNQMMGASATALSEILNRTISISTPEAVAVENIESTSDALIGEISEGDNVVAVSFKMAIDSVMDTTFCSFLSPELVQKLIGDVNEVASGADKSKNAAPDGKAAEILRNDPYGDAKARMETPAPPPMPQQAAPQMQPMPQPIPQPMPQPMPQPVMQYAPRPAEVTYVAQQPGTRQSQGPVSVMNAEFPEFSQGMVHPLMEKNLELLMGVQLDVSVVIGKTKRKIREIADFGQGSVLELNKQTGAPADIVVNGQLIAHGDVIVVGDSFGVRITDIVGTKELMDSLESNM